jgi:hypothetical protein
MWAGGDDGQCDEHVIACSRKMKSFSVLECVVSACARMCACTSVCVYACAIVCVCVCVRVCMCVLLTLLSLLLRSSEAGKTAFLSCSVPFAMPASVHDMTVNLLIIIWDMYA